MIRASRTMFCAAMAIGACVAASGATSAATGNAAPAQRLVDAVVMDHPELLDVLMHVTPPGRMRNVVIAAHLPKDLGEISGADDLGVAQTGRPLIEIQKDGVRIGVLLPMRDAHRRRIGAIGLMFPWRPGDSEAAFLGRATHIRDEIAARIPSRKSLFTAG